MRSLRNRLGALEAVTPASDQGRPFLWAAGVSLADALADAGLSLADKPLLAIQLVGLGQPSCPLHERDGHLVA